MVPQQLLWGSLYLSDDASNRTKWKLPDASINPGQFLLFWADKDEEEGPYHTNFKLSSGGEHIGIYDSKTFGNRKIDAFDFGEQTTDISEGLFTDGGEQIVFFNDPTPKASNEVTGVEDLNEFSFQLMPNPAFDHVQISSKGQNSGFLMIYDTNGVIHHKQKLNGLFNFIDITTWRSGVYYVVYVGVGEYRVIEKLIVSK